MKRKNRNKLSSSRKKYKGYIIAAIITELFVFAAVNFIIYLWHCYALEESAAEFSIKLLIPFLDFIGNPVFSVPVTIGLVGKISLTQITSMWWIHLTIILFFFLAASNQADRDYKGIEKGSADWATSKDEQQFKDTTGIPMGNDFYASIKNSNKVSYVPHNLNEMVIGGSGAGKSFRKIKPDIMGMFGSYVVTDPKGELYKDTAQLLKKNGYRVRVLNLINVELTNTYNPFMYMRSEQDVISISDLFMKNTSGEGEKDDFWSNSAKDLLSAIMIYLFKTESETKTFGRVVRLVSSLSYDDGVVDPKCELARCMATHALTYPQDAASIIWASVKGTPEQTMGGIAKTLSTRLGLWTVEAVDLLTASDEMDFDNIGVEKTAIFVITPPARNPYKSIINIFYSQLFERLMYCANFKHNGKLPLLVSCELDEFANIGQIPNFNETLAVVRSHNIRLCIVLQGLSQLKALYEKTWESIIGNCSLFLYLGSQDNDTRKYISEKLGKTTVRSESSSYNRGGQGGGSRSEHYDTRDLVEVTELPKIIAVNKYSKKYGGNCIVFIDEFSPFYLQKFDTLSHPLIKEVGGPFPSDKNTDINKEYAELYELRRSGGNKPSPSKVEEMMEQNYDDDRQVKLAALFNSSENADGLSDDEIKQIRLKELFESADSADNSTSEVPISDIDDMANVVSQSDDEEEEFMADDEFSSEDFM